MFRYFLSIGYTYLDAFFKAFEDPLAIMREGVTIVIPPIKKLSNILARIDANTPLTKLLKELNIINKTFEVVTSFNHSTSNKGSVAGALTNSGSPAIGQDGYIPNFWIFPEEPPEFWRSRVYVGEPAEEFMVENATWLNFIYTYSTAYLFSKSRFSSPGEVRGYLNNLQAYGVGEPLAGCYREGVKAMDILLNLCLPPLPYPYYPYYIGWNNSETPGKYMTRFKPFVIKITSTLQNPPVLILSLTRGSGAAGYNVHGLTFLGKLISGHQVYGISSQGRHGDFVIPNDWVAGARYMAISVPIKIRYYYDAFILTYRVMEYWGDPSYWIAIPTPAIIPYYFEEEEYSWDQWDVSWFDALGGCVASSGRTTCLVPNITSLIQDWIGIYTYTEKLYDHTLRINLYNEIPEFTTVIDYIGGNYSLVGGGFASVLWGISMSSLSLTFSKHSMAASIMFSIIGTFFGIADQTFYESATYIFLEWRRLDTQPNIYVEVVKVSHSVAGSNVYYNVGKVPLVAMYEVRIHPQPSGSPPCPPNVPDCLLPENETMSSQNSASP